MKPIHLSALYFLAYAFWPPFAEAQQAEGAQVQEIRKAFDSALFVYRFESVETPCVYIDLKNNRYADARRKIINSDYRMHPGKDIAHSADTKCLSEHCARYLRLTADCYDTTNLTINGKVQTTYTYPASSLIQFLSGTRDSTRKEDAFFRSLISSKGTFRLYPENDKYRIWLVLEDDPYEKGDTVFGYVTISQEAFNPAHRQSVALIFDKMSIYKGDNNNQISLQFSSTSHNDEALYYSALAYFVLKGEDSRDTQQIANAVWLKNFLKNPQCALVYDMAEAIKRSQKKEPFRLPDTEPIPPH